MLSCASAATPGAGDSVIEVECRPMSSTSAYVSCRAGQNAEKVEGGGEVGAGQVTTDRELIAAFQEVRTAHTDKLCFIEAVTDPQDCSYEILEWGARLANYTGRPPNPQ